MPNANGRRVELRDPVNNHEKFYRIFTVEGQAYTLLNWGRIGTEGQWMVKSGQGIAERQYDEKTREGYETVLPDFHRDLNFEISAGLIGALRQDFSTGNRRSANYTALAAHFQQAIGTYGRPAAAAKTDQEQRDAFLANLLAKRDKYRTPLDLDAPEPPPVPAVPTLDPNSMEGKLAAALAAAEAKAKTS